MEISAHHEYGAEPAAVHTMLTNPEWLSAVLDRAGAARSDVRVEANTSHIHAEISAPSQVQRFTGATLAIEQTFVWNEVPDGWDGTVEATPAKLPAKLAGTATIRPGGAGTIVEYSGQFNVSVPLLGKKLEQLAEPRVMTIIDLQQEVGNEWLATRPD
ncbi:Protein of unknown function [Propionibacterium cyclohexanicum]|uniref:DUF2505 domain-containing protein n=1 Tax=Propionibacterium cyclohexanicum TaxID=64702 RepID=A0A1H9RAP9_9ACTN|nr:DUF2505 domain-containing protein [Propionibacterium cyclohexanicum]SER69760.1 Protein of unknown function [Propionibacterium cyclohexanicum]